MRDQSKVMRVLRGEVVEPSPIWLMRQAGRYLPEYRETRAQAGSFLDLCFSPELATEVTLQPIRRFGFDAAILFSDILTIPWGLGQHLEFVEGEGPRLDPITTSDAFAKLDENQMLSRLEPVFEAVRRIRAALPEETPLIGFAGAPWTLATYVIGGRGSVDHAPAKQLAAEDPALFDAIIALMTRSVTALLRAQIEAGVDIVKIFDSWAGSAPASMRSSAIIQPTASIVADLRDFSQNTPIIAFPRGFGLSLPEFEQAVRPDGLALDTGASAEAARRLSMSAARCLQGNLDPLRLLGAPEALTSELERQKAAFRGAPHILNLGHGITPTARIETVEHMISWWRAH